MSTDRETSRIVRSWLEEGVTTLPDRVLDAVLDQVPATPQRRSWWPARRIALMTSYSRIGIAAAAVIVVALVGYSVLPGLGGPGATPTPTPAPVASSAPTADATSAPRLPEGPVNAGTYSLDNAPAITVDIPAGMSSCCQGFAIFPTADDSISFLYDDVTTITVYGDPCDSESTPVSEPRGAQSIAAAIAAQPDRQGTQPEAVTVGGRPGFHVRITVPDNLNVTSQSDGDDTFVDCDGGEFRTYATRAGVRYQQRLSQIDDIYLVDVGSSTVLFDLFSYPETAASGRETLNVLLGSVRIE